MITIAKINNGQDIILRDAECTFAFVNRNGTIAYDGYCNCRLTLVEGMTPEQIENHYRAIVEAEKLTHAEIIAIADSRVPDINAA
jgi:hypothetical protein